MGRPKKVVLPQEPSADDTWYMYLVNYWVPFPSSEYGGLQCVIARNKEEVKAVIKEIAGELLLDSFHDSDARIEARVNKASVYELVKTQSITYPHMIKSFET
jgi:hypothetical protein